MIQHTHGCEVCGSELVCTILKCTVGATITCSRCSREAFPLHETIETIFRNAMQEIALLTGAAADSMHSSLSFHVPANTYDQMDVAETPALTATVGGKETILPPVKVVRMGNYQQINLLRD